MSLSRVFVVFSLLALFLSPGAAGADQWWGGDVEYVNASWSVTEGCATRTTYVSAADDLQWSREQTGPRLAASASWVVVDSFVYDACTNEYTDHYSGIGPLADDAFTASANLDEARLVAALSITNVVTGESLTAEVDLAFTATAAPLTSRYFDKQRNPFISVFHGSGSGVFRGADASGSVRIGGRELAAGDELVELGAGRFHSLFSAWDPFALLRAAVSSGDTTTTQEEAAWGNWSSWSDDGCRLTETWVIARHSLNDQAESRDFSFLSQVWDQCAQWVVSSLEGQSTLQSGEFDYDRSGRVRLHGTLTASDWRNGRVAPVSVDLTFDPTGPAASRRTRDILESADGKYTVRVDERWHWGGTAVDPEARSLDIAGSIMVDGSPFEPGQLNWSNASERFVRATTPGA